MAFKSSTGRRFSTSSSIGDWAFGSRSFGGAAGAEDAMVAEPHRVQTQPYRFAAYNCPELRYAVYALPNNEKPEPDRYPELVLVQEESNTPFEAIVERLYLASLKIPHLLGMLLTGVDQTPFRVYLVPTQYQLACLPRETCFLTLPTVLSHLEAPAPSSTFSVPKCDEKDHHIVTEVRFCDENADDFTPDIFAHQRYNVQLCLMLKEDALLDALRELCDQKGLHPPQRLRMLGDHVVCAVRCALVSRQFTTEFLRSGAHATLLGLLEPSVGVNLFKDNDTILCTFVDTMYIILYRALHCKDEKHLRRVADVKKPPRSKNATVVDSPLQQVLEPVHRFYGPDDIQAFRDFAGDTAFLHKLVGILVRTRVSHEQLWKEGGSYGILATLSLIAHLPQFSLNPMQVDAIFKIISEETTSGDGEFFPAEKKEGRNRVANFEPDTARALASYAVQSTNQKRLTSFFYAIRLANDITTQYNGQRQGTVDTEEIPYSAKEDLILRKYVEVVQNAGIADKLFRVQFKQHLALMYPYSALNALNAMQSEEGGTGKKKMLHEKAHKLLIRIYHFSFFHFHRDAIHTFHQPDSQEVKEWQKRISAAVEKKFGTFMSPLKRASLLDFQSLSEEPFVRSIHLQVLEHFMENIDKQTRMRVDLLNPFYIPVPLVKTAYYVTEFVLRRLGLRARALVAPKLSNPAPTAHMGQGGFRLEGNFLLDLYLYFFQRNTCPKPEDFFDLTSNLIGNFVKTFIWFRKEDPNKHFYKVVEWEARSVSMAVEMLAGCSPHPNKENKSLLLEHILHDKASTLPTQPPIMSVEVLNMREQCQRESEVICREQCLNSHLQRPCQFNATFSVPASEPGEKTISERCTATVTIWKTSGAEKRSGGPRDSVNSPWGEEGGREAGMGYRLEYMIHQKMKDVKQPPMQQSYSIGSYLSI